MKLQYSELTEKQKQVADVVFYNVNMENYLYEINFSSGEIISRHKLIHKPTSWKYPRSFSVFQD